MTKQNHNRLKTLHKEHLKVKHPDLPEHFYPQKVWNDKSANALTRCVIDFLTFSGWQAERISNTGRFIRDKNSLQGGYYIPGSGTNGTADISATIKPNNLPYGISVKIEIKYGKDRQSEAQKQYQEMIEKAGGVYLIVRNFDEFCEWYDNFINFKA